MEGWRNSWPDIYKNKHLSVMLISSAMVDENSVHVEVGNCGKAVYVEFDKFAVLEEATILEQALYTEYGAQLNQNMFPFHIRAHRNFCNFC